MEMCLPNTIMEALFISFKTVIINHQLQVCARQQAHLRPLWNHSVTQFVVKPHYLLLEDSHVHNAVKGILTKCKFEVSRDQM